MSAARWLFLAEIHAKQGNEEEHNGSDEGDGGEDFIHASLLGAGEDVHLVATGDGRRSTFTLAGLHKADDDQKNRHDEQDYFSGAHVLPPLFKLYDYKDISFRINKY